MITMTAFLFSGVAAFCFLIGVLIGICGVGGILIIPFSVYVTGIDIHTVIPACMAGFAISMIFAVYSYASRGSIRWDKAVYLIVGAAPGAYLGSITVLALSSLTLEIIVFALVVVSGIRALFSAPSDPKESGFEKVPNFSLLILGLLVGYGSSVSGTGGPLLLIPSLLLLNFPVMVAVGLSMAILMPITSFATLGHLMHGTIAWSLAAPIAIGMSAGILIGAVIAHRISADVMQRTVGVVLLVSGAMVAVNFVN